MAGEETEVPPTLSAKTSLLLLKLHVPSGDAELTHIR
jgi:hypothetical protein